MTNTVDTILGKSSNGEDKSLLAILLAPAALHRQQAHFHRHGELITRTSFLGRASASRLMLTARYVTRPDGARGYHAEAKTKHPWLVEDGVVTGGMIKRVSPAMIHTYFDYIITEYRRTTTDHGMLLVQLHGGGAGQPWATVAARRMLARAGRRAGLGVVKPHAFRHSFTSAVLDASDGNVMIARDAGGWTSAAMIDEIYGHVDVHDPIFDAALRRVWGES